MKKNNQGLFKMAAMLALGAAAFGMGAPSSNAKTTGQIQQQSRRDAIRQMPQAVRPVSNRRNPIGFSNDNPYKATRWSGGNQRQTRKHWKQVPHTRPVKNRK